LPLLKFQPSYVYFFSVCVSGDYVPIIRRNNCIYATLRTCYSVRTTGMQGGMKLVHQVGFIYKIIQGCTVNKT